MIGPVPALFLPFRKNRDGNGPVRSAGGNVPCAPFSGRAVLCGGRRKVSRRGGAREGHFPEAWHFYRDVQYPVGTHNDFCLNGSYRSATCRGDSSVSLLSGKSTCPPVILIFRFILTRSVGTVKGS